MKHACSQGCGCKKAPLEPADAVWHNPTEYNLAQHGPPYLPGKQANLGLNPTERKSVQEWLQKSAAYYDTNPPLSEGDLKPLPVLLACLKALAHVHQTHHWQTQGAQFYGDHILFERLYNESLPFIDELAERAVGSEGPDAVDAEAQAMFSTNFVRQLYRGRGTLTPDQMVAASLEGESVLLWLVKRVLDKLGGTDSLSPGTINLLEGLSDKHEQFTYLLKQRAALRTASYDRR